MPIIKQTIRFSIKEAAILNRILILLQKIARLIPYKLLDKFYLSLDKPQILRTKNLQLIPPESNRRGGKHSYAEWAHVIGITDHGFKEMVSKSGLTLKEHYQGNWKDIPGLYFQDVVVFEKQ